MRQDEKATSDEAKDGETKKMNFRAMQEAVPKGKLVSWTVSLNIPTPAVVTQARPLAGAVPDYPGW